MRMSRASKVLPALDRYGSGGSGSIRDDGTYSRGGGEPRRFAGVYPALNKRDPVKERNQPPERLQDPVSPLAGKLHPFASPRLV